MQYLLLLLTVGKMHIFSVPECGMLPRIAKFVKTLLWSGHVCLQFSAAALQLLLGRPLDAGRPGRPTLKIVSLTVQLIGDACLALCS